MRRNHLAVVIGLVTSLAIAGCGLPGKTTAPLYLVPSAGHLAGVRS